MIPDVRTYDAVWVLCCDLQANCLFSTPAEIALSAKVAAEIPSTERSDSHSPSRPPIALAP